METFYRAYLYVDMLMDVNTLTHWGGDEIDAISQILQTFSNAFSWMKIY